MKQVGFLARMIKNLAYRSSYILHGRVLVECNLDARLKAVTKLDHADMDSVRSDVQTGKKVLEELFDLVKASFPHSRRSVEQNQKVLFFLETLVWG